MNFRSSSSLRELSEQVESRRHSREENNNSIRTSINNLTTITSEHTEEEEIWSNPREDVIPETVNDQENNLLETRQWLVFTFILIFDMTISKYFIMYLSIFTIQ